MSTPAANLAPAANGRILIVDDEAELRQALAEALSACGFAVDQAADGLAGLEAYGRCRPDLVIADLEMPGLRGLELLRRLRQRDPAARVVVLTGYGTLEIAVTAMKDGALDFLLKPVRLSRLLGVLGR